MSGDPVDDAEAAAGNPSGSGADRRGTSPAGDAPGRLSTAVVVALVLLPIVVLVGVLATRTWYPTGDQAQAELRMLSLPDDPPLVGAAGRIAADDGTQGNHPGPLMFWVPWPLYRALGGSSWAFEAATAAVNAAGLAAAVALVARRSRRRAVTLWFGATTLVLIGGYGLDALSQPWNPWVALVPFTVALLSVWAVLDGARWPLVLAVAAASYSMQAHVGYLPLLPPIVLVGAAALLWRERPRDGDLRTALRGWLPVPVAVLVGLALWSGPIVDAVRHDPSNVDILVEHFGSPDEEVIGVGGGVEALLQASNPVGPWLGYSPGVDGSILPGLALLAAWGGVALAVAVRRLDPTLARLNVVIALALLLTTAALARVFGAVYLYTFRWVVALVALEVFTLGWGAVVLAGRRVPVAPRVAPGLRVAAVAAVALLSLGTAVRVAGEENPYPRSSALAGELSRQTAADLPEGPAYLVRWEDTVYLGGPAFGLVLDLERRGYDVGVGAPHRAAAEPHRVRCGGDYDAVLTVVTGLDRIAAWRDRPEAREVAFADVRTADERVAGDSARERLASLLDLDDPAAVDSRLSQIVLDPSFPPEVVDLAGGLVDVGVPTAVFETAPGLVEAPTMC